MCACVYLEVDVLYVVGYVVDEIYEIWHFAEKSQNVFKDYIDTFKKIKYR